MPVKTKPEDGMLTKLELAAEALNLSIESDQLNGQGKTFEAWALIEIALRLQSQPGIHIEPVGHDSNPIAIFNFRGAPGHIPPKIASGEQPSHFRLRRNGGEWFELHLALEHWGDSGTTHELDISLVLAEHVETIRGGSGGAYIGFRSVALELKAYDAKRKLPKAIPRALIGAALDLDIGMVIDHFAIQTRSHTYRSLPLRAPQHWLLTTTAIADPSKKYLDAFRVRSEGGISPDSDSIFGIIAQDIAGRLW